MKARSLIFALVMILIFVTIYKFLGLEKAIDMILDPSVPDVQINR